MRKPNSSPTTAIQPDAGEVSNRRLNRPTGAQQGNAPPPESSDGEDPYESPSRAAPDDPVAQESEEPFEEIGRSENEGAMAPRACSGSGDSGCYSSDIETWFLRNAESMETAFLGVSALAMGIATGGLMAGSAAVAGTATSGAVSPALLSGAVGQIGWYTMSPRLVGTAMIAARGIEMARQELNANPGLIPSLVRFWPAAMRNPDLVRAVYGKGLEVLSAQGGRIPNLIEHVGGRSPFDYLLRGPAGDRVMAELTTLQRLGPHLHRQVFQVEEFIMFTHPGPPPGFP